MSEAQNQTIPSLDEKQPSKKALKKEQKKAEKAAKKEQRQAQIQAQQAAAEKDDCSKDKYGVLPMIQSTEKPDRVLLHIKQLSAAQAEQRVWVRGRMHTSRTVGEQLVNAFLNVHAYTASKVELNSPLGYILRFLS